MSGATGKKKAPQSSLQTLTPLCLDPRDSGGITYICTSLSRQERVGMPDMVVDAMVVHAQSVSNTAEGTGGQMLASEISYIPKREWTLPSLSDNLKIRAVHRLSNALVAAQSRGGCGNRC